MALTDRDYMRDDEPSWRGPSLHGRRWSAHIALMIVITIAFFLQQTLDGHTLEKLALNTNGLRHGYIWELITFQFLHAGFGHLAANLLGVWMFGRVIEAWFGKKSFLLIYFASGVAGGLLQALLGFLSPEKFGGALVGASAGVCGIFAAFAMFAPDAEVWLWFVLPVRARWLYLISVVIAVVFAIVPSGSNVAHAAHLGGLLAGAAWVRWKYFHQKRDDIKEIRPKPKFEVVKLAAKKMMTHAAPEEFPPEEFISREVDPILDKISAHGIHSLTDRERQILDGARKKMAGP